MEQFLVSDSIIPIPVKHLHNYINTEYRSWLTDVNEFIGDGFYFIKKQENECCTVYAQKLSNSDHTIDLRQLQAEPYLVSISPNLPGCDISINAATRHRTITNDLSRLPSSTERLFIIIELTESIEICASEAIDVIRVTKTSQYATHYDAALSRIHTFTVKTVARMPNDQ